ncbi:MAG: butyrate kinase, partial [Thermodesulfobacteriota bacterium]|nr:butyrate kinase [Thermodesulfobacteriota bacterium]
MYRILVINIGSTSTKVGVFTDETPLFVETINHETGELSPFETFIDQHVFRQKIIEDILEQRCILLEDIDVIVSRGGGTRPIETGIYGINQLMCDDLLSGKYEKHPANLGPVISFYMGRKNNIPAIIVDSPSSDEFETLARFSGIPEIKRRSGFHMLSQKAVARKAAGYLGKDYGAINLIVAHLGGGISIGAHRKGRIIDASHGIEEGPFTPERSGSLPVIEIMNLCYSGQYTRDKLLRKLVGEGGLTAYLGTHDARLIEKKILEGDEDYLSTYQAMAYQISKEIGAMATVLNGEVAIIVLTGGLAHSQILTEWITKRVDFIAPIKIFTGEDE